MRSRRAQRDAGSAAPPMAAIGVCGGMTPRDRAAIALAAACTAAVPSATPAETLPVVAEGRGALPKLLAAAPRAASAVAMAAAVPASTMCPSAETGTSPSSGCASQRSSPSLAQRTSPHSRTVGATPAPADEMAATTVSQTATTAEAIASRGPGARVPPPAPVAAGSKEDDPTCSSMVLAEDPASGRFEHAALSEALCQARAAPRA
ncbi:unnamed protein product, partial [Prorocentrum cordatum]